MCLAQGHNTVMPMRLEPAGPWSRVKHSTTEPLHSITVSNLIVLLRSVVMLFDQALKLYFFMLNSTEHEIYHAQLLKCQNMLAF